MDLELNGRRALITGASRGLGRAIAERLAEEGCQLALCARADEPLRAAAEELRARGATVHAQSVDVTDAPALEDFVDAAAQALGGLDLLVANAGGAQGGAELTDTTAEDWQRTFDLTVVHSAVVARAATRHMGEGASIVLVSSVSGLRPQPKPQYAAAKAALIHLAASLGRELGPRGIRVNALSPGSILFPGGSWERRATADPAAFAAFVEREFPHGRLGTAEEIADATAFLLSPRASWINGTNLVVDGGQNAPGMGGF